MGHFIAEYFWTIVSVLGLLTGVGTVGVCVFLGIPLMMIVTSVVDFFRSVVSFFTTPLGQVVGVVLLCVACFLAGSIAGARKEIARCHAADVDAQTRAAERDAAVKKLAAGLAAQQTEQLAKENQELNKKVAEYETALTRKRACPLDADDVKRLRRLTR